MSTISASKDIIKNLLKDNTCKSCKSNQIAEWPSAGLRSCMFWYGEAIGWQWRELPEEGTCEYYIGT